MTEDIDLSEIDKKYKDKCSLIKVGKCKNVNIFLQQSRENAELKEKIKKYAKINEQETKDYAELKAENERLNRCIMEELHHEGNAIREAIKYKQTLQEIKAIAEAPKPFIDLSETKTAIEVGYDYAAICNELELRLYKVLEKITKAEDNQ